MSGGSSLSRKVFKAISIFGTVQMITMLCSVVRVKCVALWMGPAGIGLFGLLNQAVEMLTQISQLNIRESGVRAIVRSKTLRDFISTVVSRLSIYLGLAGALLTLILAPFLGRLTFGEPGHSSVFIVLSIVVFLRVLIAGKQSILQAHDKLKRLASASLWGNISGTVISVMLFRLFGLSSIVPSIIVFAVVTWLAYVMGRNSYKTQRISFSEIVTESKPIVTLGIYMTIAAFISSLSTYLFLVWLRNYGDEESVGYYQAGFTIISQYVGLMFVAISVEFYPRVASVIHSRLRTSSYVKHEISMLQWLLAGCIVLFELLAPVIVRILYSGSFEDVTTYLLFASVGTPLRAYSVILAYIILARGDGKIYIVTESISALFYIGLNIAGYVLWGLQGAGIAYALWYLAYVIIVTFVYCHRYRYVFPWKVFVLTGCVAILTALQCFICIKQYYVVATVFAIIVSVASFTIFYKTYLARSLQKHKTA